MKDNNDIRISMGLTAAASGWQQMSQAAFWGYFNPDTEKKGPPFVIKYDFDYHT